VFSLAMAIGVAALNVFYRDIGNLTRHLLRFWFYLSPALYGQETVEQMAKEHPWIRTVFNLNPWTHLFNSYRNLVYYGQPPDWGGLAAVLGLSVVLLVGAILLFKRAEPTFAKVL
jgi:ABC-type polysaccharide/polyol phosphate export permease